ncbi:MAG: rhodanese-like domain-containing protein [Phycisphaerales bacterium]|nr:MAG: rhodanese-like domain-containing protein [Phycisphaerales bacterium]
MRAVRTPGALSIPHRHVATRLDELEPYRDRDIMVYCEAGVRARIARTALTRAGFARAYRLIGDRAAWRRGNHAIETAPVP